MRSGILFRCLRYLILRTMRPVVVRFVAFAQSTLPQLHNPKPVLPFPVPDSLTAVLLFQFRIPETATGAPVFSVPHFFVWLIYNGIRILL